MATPASLHHRLKPPFIFPPNRTNLRSHHTKSSRHYLPFSRHFHHFPLQRNPNLNVVVRGLNSEDHVKLTHQSFDDDLEDEEDDSVMPVEISYTRTLSPALTLEHGFVKIEQEFDKLKLDPPNSKSGIIRFQVAVPPSTKALSWLCSQAESSGVFPQFYLSKDNVDQPPLDSQLFDGRPGISGMGASIHFMGNSSVSRDWISIRRYLSADSPLIRAYGYFGISFDPKLSSIKHDAGSFYIFIPKIELDECEGLSLLAATLAWDDYTFSTFEKAIDSLKFSLSQASKTNSQDRFINSALANSDLVDDNKAQMVCINANSLQEKDVRANLLQPKVAWTSYQYCFRHSPSIALTHNLMDHPHKMNCLLQCSANITAVWASLIVEECCRLGLMYFCIAPGSRSSPLAVAASTHPRTTCISCFDERSLAFHALGYARGSGRPAIVITSSGTAVSNLLPAVVEASQDLVPLLLLTADRPPELHDTGANQSINQVHHFGSFVRSSFSLPVPTDHIPARMVLSTIDSAIYCATNGPSGPVHINCAFREPLEKSEREWMLSCLKCLDIWMSGSEPFTKYMRLQPSHAYNSTQRLHDDILNIIKSAKKGLLLIGGIHTEDEMWAALLLAKHLSWPTVADILSGLRFKKVLTEISWFAEKNLFIDHLDHALLSNSVRDWAQPDVIIQVGSRITSKRISQMLEVCSPCPYIMVANHPYRHDPSHIVTHRVQSTITEFADSVCRIQVPKMNCRWSEFMQALNMMVAKEIEFQIQSEYSLTEPHVVQVLSETLPSDSAVFIGNSMVIRDADMYGRGWNHVATYSTSMSNWEVPCIGMRASGNRGASGIDGLLSTAIGFAVGSYKRVFCLIGDISFLHDTNGLSLLKQRTRGKPLTILVINNHGGAIFSLLPIAEKTEPSVLNRYFYTSHNVSIGKLCEAHSVNHLQVHTKMDLQRALLTSREMDADCIIEVESCIEDNATFHSTLQRSARQAAENTLNVISGLPLPDQMSSDFLHGKIHKLEYSLYRIQLSAPLTSTRGSGGSSLIYKEGFILSIHLEDGSVGFGEVAPLEIHKENLQDVEEQLRFLIHIIQGTKLSHLLPLLRGTFSSWIRDHLGILPQTIFPSVRCGMEMAVLNALAARQSCSLSNLLHRGCCTLETQSSEAFKRSSKVQICALLDSSMVPEEVAIIAGELVKEGFSAIKIKVGRRADPLEDASVIIEIRKKIGYQVKLRADANRSWTYEQASQFGSAVINCDLQYIEEPVNSEDDILKFCDDSGLPVALDETIDSIQGDPLGRLANFVHPGIVAVVIKPSVVGGFENAALIAKWAQKHNKMAVISSAFESSLGLSAYIQFSHFLEQQNADMCSVLNKELREPIAHGLGTYKWLKEDVTFESLQMRGHPYNESVEVSIEDSAQFLSKFKINSEVIQRSYSGECVRQYQMDVDYENFSCSFKVREVGKIEESMVIVFLHGFLGSSEDWIPMMKACSTFARCISIDLPGHGGSMIERHGNNGSCVEPSLQMEIIANMLSKLICKTTPGNVILVGYSMGARIALYMALRCGNQIDGAVVISGSPGLQDARARRKRISQDDARAQSLKAHGLDFFLDRWYSGELWRSLRAHPKFKQIISSRAQHRDVEALANALSFYSIGRQQSLWDELKVNRKPLLFIYGEKDKKFKEINQKMFNEVRTGSKGEEIHEIKEITDCGHAVHLENPLPLINAISKFSNKISEKIA
ncbi:hypothetical protein ACHQM5_008779 [Ranunculus cassubicifolius]